MAEYSRLARGSFISDGSAKIINLPFLPDFIEFLNKEAFETPAQDNIPQGWWDVDMDQDTALVNVFNVTPVLTTQLVTEDGFKTFVAGQLLQYGASIAIETVTKANPAVVTTVADHGLASGDVIIMNNLYQTAATGMQQIGGVPFTITVTDTDEFTIEWNTNQSNYTAYDVATSTQAAFLKKVLYPYLYFPGQNVIDSISTGATTTIHTTTAHNYVVGQEVAFRVPTIWGTQQLNSLPNIITPGSPIYAYVIEVTDYNSFVVNVNSTAYTAFNSNQPFINFPGQSFAQVVAVGDVNTGGVQISSGSQLYPPPYSVPFGNGNTSVAGAFPARVNTINGPAIMGAYVNNTSQGFVMGSALVGDEEDHIFWRAYLHDYSNP